MKKIQYMNGDYWSDTNFTSIVSVCYKLHDKSDVTCCKNIDF